MPERQVGVGLDRAGIDRKTRLSIAEDLRDRPGHCFEPAGHNADRREVRLLSDSDRPHHPRRAAPARTNSHDGRVGVRHRELLAERVEYGVVVTEVAGELRVVNELDVRVPRTEPLLKRAQDLVTLEEVVPDQRDAGTGQLREPRPGALPVLGRAPERPQRRVRRLCFTHGSPRTISSRHDAKSVSASAAHIKAPGKATVPGYRRLARLPVARRDHDGLDDLLSR